MVTNDQCSAKHKIDRWLIATCLTIVMAMAPGVYWAVTEASEAKQAVGVQAERDEWIVKALERIEARLDSYHLPGGE